MMRRQTVECSNAKPLYIMSTTTIGKTVIADVKAAASAEVFGVLVDKILLHLTCSYVNPLH